MTGTGNDQPLMTLRGIGKKYGRQLVLSDINLEFRKGELTAVVGRNGSGKSTMLRIAAGVTAASAGERRTPAGYASPVIGYAPDRLPALRFTATEYLTRMAAIDGMDAREAAEAIQDLLTRLALPEASANRTWMKHYSKGMLQKVNLAQALLRKPELLLLDEPFGGLDSASREEMTRALSEVRRSGTAIVIASHDREWAARLADRCAEIERGRLVRDEKMPGRQAASWREVLCELGDPALRETIGRLEQVRGRSLEGEMLRLSVEAKDSDGLLRELLAAGARILEVTAEKEGTPPWL